MSESVKRVLGNMFFRTCKGTHFLRMYYFCAPINPIHKQVLKIIFTKEGVTGSQMLPSGEGAYVLCDRGRRKQMRRKDVLST